MHVYDIEFAVTTAMLLLVLVVKAFALFAAIRYSAEAYHAGDKWSKAGWVTILAIGLVAQLVLYSSPLNIIHLAFTVAACVFLVDVRPALAEITRRR